MLKISLAFFLLVFLNYSNAQIKNSYIREGSLGKRITAETPEVKEAFSFVPLSKWVGERFIFLPLPKELQRYGYQNFGVDYKNYVGRIAVVTSADESGNSPQLSIKMEDNEERIEATGVFSEDIYFYGIGLLADIDSARSKWLNKTLWYKKDQLSLYDEANNKFENIKIKKCSPVKVVDIIAGWYNDTPVRFIVQSSSGDEGFVDLNLSGTNVTSILRQNNKFNEKFFTEDPRKTFQWSTKVWSAIERGKVFVGMTSEQAILSWGKPRDINRTNKGNIVHEKWVYASGSYLYFKNNVLKIFQK
mgnify:CR=1 FL=1